MGEVWDWAFAMTPLLLAQPDQFWALVHHITKEPCIGCARTAKVHLCAAGRSCKPEPLARLAAACAFWPLHPLDTGDSHSMSTTCLARISRPRHCHSHMTSQTRHTGDASGQARHYAPQPDPSRTCDCIVELPENRAHARGPPKLLQSFRFMLGSCSGQHLQPSSRNSPTHSRFSTNICNPLAHFWLSSLRLSASASSHWS